MTSKHIKLQGGGLRPLRHLLITGLVALPLAACDTDELVAVEDPARLRPEQFDNAAAIPQLIAGSLRQFVGGYSGFGDDSFLAASAVISDEFYWGDTFTTRYAADSRNLQPAVLGNISDPAFLRLQQARLNAGRTIATIDRFSTPATADEDAANKSFLRTIQGYVYVTLSEGWCGAVPFSDVPLSGTIDPSLIVEGPGLSTQAMNDTAVVRFNEALALSEDNPDISLASIGKARALMNNGKFAEAAAAVADVPTNYVFQLEHSITNGSQNNPIFSLQSNGRYGVSNLEGGASRPDIRIPPLTATGAEGVPFRGLQDPRVPYEGRAAANNRCFSSAATCWLNNNYPGENSDVPLASGVEARLIEAEAAMRSGDAEGMLEILNDLRSELPSLIQILYTEAEQTFPRLPAAVTVGQLTLPATPAAVRDLFFRERAMWLYNTGHRQGDLRRLARPTTQGGYGLGTGVFPSGSYFRGGSYGGDVAYPVPFNEENNTQFQRAQCVTTQA